MEENFINLLGPISILNVVSGVCIPGLSSKYKRYQTLSTIYCVFIQLLCYSQTICCIIVVLDFNHAINVVHVSTILTMLIGTSFWSTYLLIYRKHLRRIVNRIDVVIQKFNKLNFGLDTKFEDDLKIEFQMTKRIVIGIFISFAALPIVNNTQKLFRSLRLFGSDGVKHHNYQAPYDANVSPVYEISLLIQGSTLFLTCTAQGCNVQLFSTLYFILSVFFKHLQKTIDNKQFWQYVSIESRSNSANSKSSKLENVLEENESNEIDEKQLTQYEDSERKYSLAYLKMWIEMHQEVLSISQDVIEFYSPLLAVYFLYLYISVAFTLFTGVQNTHTHTLVELMVLAYFSFLTLFNFYLLCSYGHYIMVHSEKVTWNVYAAPWVESNRQHKSLAKMILLRASRPLIVNCYSSTTFDLSNATFIVILKSIVSFYLGLVQMKKQ